MPTYATITTSVTGHGSDEAATVTLLARPVVKNGVLTYPSETGRMSLGVESARADDDGLIRLSIPLDTTPTAPPWRLEMRIDSGWGKARNIDLGSFQVTESTTLAALMFPDMAEPVPAVTVVDNGDGTVTFSGAGVTDNGDGTATLSSPNAVDNGDGTFTFAA